MAVLLIVSDLSMNQYWTTASIGVVERQRKEAGVLEILSTASKSCSSRVSTSLRLGDYDSAGV